ncbi:hypothetical protein GF312_20730 [Candidatus Poribacteria bacterium]|nr:hypothetical protein [Candidatus Poribacteria bacterium]
MGKNKTLFISFVSLLLMVVCVFAQSAEVSISRLEEQLQSLQNQKAKLDSEMQILLKESDKLSYEIDELKIQSQGGLGIIGRFKLSRKLRHAQNLSENIQALEKQIYDIEKSISVKKDELGKEYDKYIEILIDKLDKSQEPAEQKEILEELNEIRTAKEKLTKNQEQDIEILDISKIEIKEYDGPQEIREKADLINDFAAKYSSGIDRINARIEKLKEELDTRSKLGEFAEEINFFNERILKEELVANSENERAQLSNPKNSEETSTVNTEPITKTNDSTESGRFSEDSNNIDAPLPDGVDTVDTSDKRLSESDAQTPPVSISRTVVERNGVSADFNGSPVNQLEEAIVLLERQKQKLKEQLETIKEKADTFYKKADEIEKSETGKGEETRQDHLENKTAK